MDCTAEAQEREWHPEGSEAGNEEFPLAGNLSEQPPHPKQRDGTVCLQGDSPSCGDSLSKMRATVETLSLQMALGLAVTSWCGQLCWSNHAT